MHSPLPSRFPTEEELQGLVSNNELLPYYKRLRSEHPIDYDSLASTAKNLKTLSDDLRKTAISYFKKMDDDSSDDSCSSNENKNLVDQML